MFLTDSGVKGIGKEWTNPAIKSEKYWQRMDETGRPIKSEN